MSSTVSGAPVQIKSWQLGREVGRGAFTVVYQAKPGGCPGAGDYAVKLLLPEYVRDRTALAMLQREVFVATQVQHPHLTTVLASELDGAPQYLVTPLYTGATLGQTLTRGERLPTPHALWIARQIAEALEALHNAGWRHGDVNSGNVIVAPTGHATLIDLGLAGRNDDREAGRQMLAGTPAYMAPEVFHSSGRLTPAADIYSLGVVLYQVLVGTLPFEDDDPLDLVTAQLEAPPPSLRQRLPHVPTRLARLVRRMLAKEPLRRPATDELIAMLTDLEIETFAERLVA